MSDEMNNKRPNDEVDVFELFDYFGNKVRQFTRWIVWLVQSVLYLLADLVIVTKRRWYIWLITLAISVLMLHGNSLFVQKETEGQDAFSKTITVKTKFNSSKNLVLLIKSINQQLQEAEYQELSTKLYLSTDYLKKVTKLSLRVNFEIASFLEKNSLVLNDLSSSVSEKDESIPLAQQLIGAYQNRTWESMDDMVGDPYFSLFDTFLLQVETSEEFNISPLVLAIVKYIEQDSRIVLDQQSMKKQLELEKENLEEEKQLIKKTIEHLLVQSKNKRVDIDLRPSEELSKLHAQLERINSKIIENGRMYIQSTEILSLGNFTPKQDLTVYEKAPLLIRNKKMLNTLWLSFIIFYGFISISWVMRWLKNYEKSKQI